MGLPSSAAACSDLRQEEDRVVGLEIGSLANKNGVDVNFVGSGSWR